MQQRVIEVGDQLPKRGNRFTRWLGTMLLWLIGWRVTGALPNVTKSVMIGAPHTTNYDGVVAVASLLALGIRINIFVKHTLFTGLGEVILRFLGCIPVDRTAAHGLIAESANMFDQHERLMIGVAPEGTRKAAKTWKKGFYYIALKANIPIIVAVLDYENKEARVALTLYPTGDYDADMAKIMECYKGVKGGKVERMSQPLQELNKHHNA